MINSLQYIPAIYLNKQVVNNKEHYTKFSTFTNTSPVFTKAHLIYFTANSNEQANLINLFERLRDGDEAQPFEIDSVRKLLTGRVRCDIAKVIRCYGELVKNGQIQNVSEDEMKTLLRSLNNKGNEVIRSAAVKTMGLLATAEKIDRIDIEKDLDKITGALDSEDNVTFSSALVTIGQLADKQIIQPSDIRESYLEKIIRSLDSDDEITSDLARTTVRKLHNSGILKPEFIRERNLWGQINKLPRSLKDQLTSFPPRKAA